MSTKVKKSKSPALAWFGWTDRGKIRQNNEDAFVGLRFDNREVERLGKNGDSTLTNKDFVFAVSDGVGGSALGEYASRIAVEKIMTMLPKGYEEAREKKEALALETLVALYAEVHKALKFLGSSYDECAGMEATLSVAWFTAGKLFFAHIGDTRIYLIPKGSKKVIQLSEDDTHVAWLLRNQKITPAEARWHPGRKVLQKALGGTHQFVDPQIGAVEFSKGDVFMICSDGLIEGLEESNLAETICGVLKKKAKGNPAQLLVQNSLSNSGSDNTTALLIEAC